MAMKIKIDRGLVLAAVAILTWVLIGAIVYYAVGNCSEVPRLTKDGELIEGYSICPWRFSHAFYFSVQTGLSIGFGLMSESKKISELYSCFHILAGSSFIGGALSFFVSFALTRQRNYLSRSERRLMKACVAIHADSYHGLSAHQLREMMLMHPQYARALIRKVHPSGVEATKHIKEFESADDDTRKRLASEILTKAQDKLECFREGSMKMADLVDIDAQNAGWHRKLLRTLRARASFLRIAAAFVAWITIGALFSAVADENDLISSVYFAIAALSTAGMVATKTVESDAHVVFVGFYCLVGVPLYAAMLGSFANLLTENYMEKQTASTLNATLTDAETEYLSHLAEADGNQVVNLAEYTELQLLRLGVVDRDTLKQIKEQFAKYDKEGKGKLALREFVHEHHLPQKEEASA